MSANSTEPALLADTKAANARRRDWHRVGLLLNSGGWRVDEGGMASPFARVTGDQITRTPISAGMVLVNAMGQVKIVRSRTADGAGWNCADGAAIDDETASNPAFWDAYTPEELVAALGLARELRAISGQRELSGGLATWDACSGRPCVLPKLAKLVP